MPLRKESKRGLIALAVLCALGLATLAFGSSAVRRLGGEDSVAARLKQAK